MEHTKNINNEKLEKGDCTALIIAALEVMLPIVFIALFIVAIAIFIVF